MVLSHFWIHGDRVRRPEAFTITLSFIGVAVCALMTTHALTRPHEFVQQGRSDGA